MKIYAVKWVTWIEDHYKMDSIHEEYIFLARKSAENILNEMKTGKPEEKGKFVDVEKDGIHYLVSYRGDYSGYGNITEDNVVDLFWGNECALWYYIEELEVQ